MIGKIRRSWPREGKHEVVGRALDGRPIGVVCRITMERYILIRGVPVGVCTECGMRYFAANVLKTVEETARGRREAEREILMPVYSFVAT